MTLGELMKDRNVDPAFKGQITANDMVLAVNLENAEAPDEYIVAQPFVSEHSGTIESGTTDSQYIRTGKTTTRTDATRKIEVKGDRFVGDPFQDGILGHDIKYGKGSNVVKDYVYFAIQNGKGEKGQVTINVSEDAVGAAGDNASFSATLTSVGTPDEYDYIAV